MGRVGTSSVEAINLGSCSRGLVAGTAATDQSRSFISASVNVQYCMQLPVRQRVKPAINELYHRRSLRLNRSIIRLERKRKCRIRTGKYSGRTTGRRIFPLVFLPHAQPVSVIQDRKLVVEEKSGTVSVDIGGSRK